MNDTLRYVCRHNVWASRTLLAECKLLTAEQLSAPAVASYGTIIETFRHLVMSDAGYLRALGGPETSWLSDYRRALDEVAEPWSEGPMEDGDLDELGRRIDETEQLWDGFLADAEFDAERVSVLDAGTYECPAGIVMAQVFHHGSLHREQICATLSALGVEPPDLQPWASPMPLASAASSEVERVSWNRITTVTADGGNTGIITYSSRVRIDIKELQALFARAWGGRGKQNYEQVLERSFTWIAAHRDERLVGFVNVAWDGGVHFFMLDTTVDPELQRMGVGTELVRRAIDACRGQGEWMHVDSDDELMEHLYFAAGFRPASAGFVDVRE